LYWKKNEWKDGYASLSDENRAQSVKMSSYEVMDSLLVQILTSENFPNIQRVVVAGHSAGGQFVQRYSAMTPVPDRLTAFTFRFIVMDPSSFMYPDDKRPLGNKTYSIPDTSGCPGYNRYPKGLTALNSYAKALGADHIRQNILKRDIIILLGENDTRTDDPNLDVSCAANLQGPYRLERGLNYVAYLATFAEYGHKVNYNIVPGSGHDGKKMINSSEAKKWIYGQAGE
jgi:pimeloyl-ACP methyl ester carboxylesterase